jgi:pimeloyl-ACP methyl ester carboxylesterase
VQDFASSLGLERFAILGASGGGPYALACAKQIPKEKLTAVGVLAGAAVWDKGIRTKGVPWYARVGYFGANYCQGLLRLVTAALVGIARWVMTRKWVERKIDGVLEAAVKAKVAREKRESEDRESEEGVLISKEGEGGNELPPVRTTARRREGFMGLFFEGFAQGTAELVREAKLLTNDWGFRFEDVSYDRVLVWHGSKDVNAPVERIRVMVEQIPHCVLREFDESHFGMGHHCEEILDELIDEIERNYAGEGLR